jgi:hypothetical protein
MPRRALALACALLTAAVGTAGASEAVAESPRLPAASLHAKLDRALLARARAAPAFGGRSRVIIRTVDGRPATHLVEAFHGIAGRYFEWLGGQVAIVPDTALERLARRPEVAGISLDRAVRSTMERTTSSTGARWVTEQLGVTGSGVGVATIDSGVNPWHEDLDGRIAFRRPRPAQSASHDDCGHGTSRASSRRRTPGSQQPGTHLGAAAARRAPVVLRRSTPPATTSPARHCHRLRDANRGLWQPRPQPTGSGRRLILQQDPPRSPPSAVGSGIVVVAAAAQGKDATGQPPDGGIASCNVTRMTWRPTSSAQPTGAVAWWRSSARRPAPSTGASPIVRQV